MTGSHERELPEHLRALQGGPRASSAPDLHNHEVGTDSAGQPWQGRELNEHPFAGDDGSAPPALLAALEGRASGAEDARAQTSDALPRTRPELVVEALASARVLIPIVAAVGEYGVNEAGHVIDKEAELSIVTVEGPDGRPVLPVFSSTSAMAAWNADARPVPVEAQRAAIAAAAEQTPLIVVDPASEHRVVLRRPALEALAKGEAWQPWWRDPEVPAAFASLLPITGIERIELANGDPDGLQTSADCTMVVTLTAELPREAAAAALQELGRRASANATIATRLDSLDMRVRTA